MLELEYQAQHTPSIKIKSTTKFDCGKALTGPQDILDGQYYPLCALK